MKIESATLSKGVTLSIAKFEFVKIDYSLTVRAEKSDELSDVHSYLAKEVDDGLQSEIDRTLDDLKIEHIRVTVKKKTNKNSPNRRIRRR